MKQDYEVVAEVTLRRVLYGKAKNLGHAISIWPQWECTYETHVGAPRVVSVREVDMSVPNNES